MKGFRPEQIAVALMLAGLIIFIIWRRGF